MKPRDTRTAVAGLNHIQRVSVDMDAMVERVRRLEQRNAYNIPIIDTLPSSAVEGQSVYFQTASMAVDGIVWELRFNDTGGPYPWKFIGGAALYDYTSTAETTTSTTYVNLATVGPDVSAPLPGVYAVTFGASIDYSVITSNRVARCAISNAGSTPSDTNSVRSAHPNLTGMVQTHSITVEQTVAAGGDTLRVQYRTAADTARFASRFISVLPVRLAA